MAFDPLEEERRREGMRGMLDAPSAFGRGGMLSAAGMPPARAMGMSSPYMSSQTPTGMLDPISQQPRDFNTPVQTDPRITWDMYTEDYNLPTLAPGDTYGPLELPPLSPTGNKARWIAKYGENYPRPWTYTNYRDKDGGQIPAFHPAWENVHENFVPLGPDGLPEGNGIGMRYAASPSPAISNVPHLPGPASFSKYIEPYPLLSTIAEDAS
jgi:hypothetical protein